MTDEQQEPEESKTPWYINAAYKLGVPAILCLLFAWAWITRIEPEYINQTELLQKHVNNTDTILTEVKKQNSEVIQILKSMETIMLQNCVNSAKTPTDRNSCFR